MAQHAQSKLIDHRKQGGELVNDGFQGFRRRRAAGLNDALLSRGERGVREGQPGAALGLKEPLLHVSRQRDAALVGFVAEPMEFLFAQIGSELSPHSSLSFTSCSFGASVAPFSFSTANFRNESCSAGAGLWRRTFPIATWSGVICAGMPLCPPSSGCSILSATGGAYSMRSLFGGGAICASRLKDGSE